MEKHHLRLAVITVNDVVHVLQISSGMVMSCNAKVKFLSYSTFYVMF